MPFDEKLLEPVENGFDPSLLEPVESPQELKQKTLLEEMAKEAEIGRITQNQFGFTQAAEPIVEPFTAAGMLNQPSRAAQIVGINIPDPFHAGVPVIDLPEPKGESTLAGLGKLASRTIESLTTPESIVTLPAAAPSAFVRALFASQMAYHLPGQVKHAAEVVTSPTATPAEKVIAVGEPTVATAMTAGLAVPSVRTTPVARNLAALERPPREIPFPPETTPEAAALFAQEFKRQEPVVEPKAPIETQVPKEEAPVLTPEAATEPNPVGMGGAVPAEFEQTPKTATGIKNATVDQERQTRGLPPAMQTARRSFGTVWDEAMAKIDQDPTVPDRLISELRENPRALTDAEDATLLHRQVELQNEYGKATRDLAQAFDDGRLADVESEKLRVQQLSDQLLDLYNINKKVGTETGRGLNARKMMAYEDFSLARMELEKRAANDGAPLTDAQRTEIQTLHEKIAETQLKYDEYVTRTEASERERTIKELVEKAPQPKVNPYIIQVAERIVGGLDKRADAARQRLREKMSRVSAGVDPTILIDLAEIGASHLGKVGLDFAKWSARMIEDVGEWSKEHLEEVFKRSQALIESEIDAKVSDKAKREGVRRSVTRQDKKEAGDAIEQAIRSKIEAGEQGEITGLVQQLAKTFVELGVKDRDTLIDAVHEELKGSLPEITRRETMDAISGYGKYKQLTKDEISVQLRDLKGQMQQVAKLEDMQAGQAPAKTGLERRTPSDKERQLIKQVNELKKKSGFVVTDPAKQLKSALDSIKTRLQHQITDLALQISTKQKIAPEKRTVTYDAEANALKSARDALKSEYDNIFGSRTLSDEQRISMATKAVERSIAEYERRIKDRDIGPRTQESKTPPSAALDALKAHREALQEQLKELRDLANPKKTPEERALQGFKSTLKRQTADLLDRLSKGDFGKRERKPIDLDKEASDLKFENEKVKRQYQEGLLKDRLAKRSTGRKIFEGIGEAMNTSRAIMTSFDLSAVLRQGGFIALSNPARSIRAIPDMLRAMVSEKNQFRIEQEILGRKNYPLYQQSKLYLAEHGHALSKMEEAYMSRLADKIPGVSHSQRAYTTFLNKLRADSFDAMAEGLGHSGQVTPIEAATISNFINVATGRGKIGLSDRAAVGLNTVFFAPRYVASRFQLLAGQPFYGGNARTRTLIAKEYAKFLGGASVVYTLAHLAGAEIESDPRSSEFGKIRFGEERLDPMGGLIQTTTFLSKMLSGKTKTGKGKLLPAKTSETVFTFLRNKLAPWPGAALDVRDILTGQKPPPGHPKTLPEVGAKLVVPISFEDIYNAMKNQGIPAGTAMAILSIFGMGLQSYPEPGQKY